jgi:hypothetical protein
MLSGSDCVLCAADRFAVLDDLLACRNRTQRELVA